MKSFEEWFGEASQDKLFWESPSKASKMGFEAGQQSKQAEVDDLKRELLNKTNEAYADGQRSMRKIIKSNEDELQKNLNNALKTIEIQQRFLDDADGANEIATSQASELQNKIDEALKLLNLAYPESWAYCVDEAINILKGDQS